MAWDSSKDGTKILTIGEMNAAKSYNIFPNITSSSADWNRCPTKSELISTSVISGGYTYTVTISNNSSFSSNQLVPNSVLSPKASSNSWNMYVNVTFYIADYEILRRDVVDSGMWTCIEGNPNITSDTIWQTNCDITIDIYTSTGSLYRSTDTIGVVTGEILYRAQSMTGVNGGTNGAFYISGIPSSTRITNIEVTVSNMFEGYASQTCNCSSSTNGTTVNVDMGYIGYSPKIK